MTFLNDITNSDTYENRWSYVWSYYAESQNNFIYLVYGDLCKIDVPFMGLYIHVWFIHIQLQTLSSLRTPPKPPFLPFQIRILIYILNTLTLYVFICTHLNEVCELGLVPRGTLEIKHQINAVKIILSDKQQYVNNEFFHIFSIVCHYTKWVYQIWVYSKNNL